MSAIDERIVSMQFDNDQFEKNIGTTLKSLTNLEKSVDGLNNVNGSAIMGTLDEISNRFSTMGIVGLTVIQNLTNRFVDMGIKMAKSLTVDQISAGFEKYTANTKTVKALLNSTGETIEVVTEKINSLSWYSDATSYSYNAMVSALKSFTAQDIKMDTAIPAIMGIGNSLSYAGLAAEEASAAFDIYSKAMGQGYLSNIQLKSLNNMGAVTAQWKQQMIDAAVAEGTLKKVGDDLYRTNQGLNVSIKEFDMTLGHQKGKWLTREVMMRVFGDVYGSYTQKLQAFMAEEENAGLTIDQAIKKFNELNGITEDFGLKAFKSAQEARTFSEAVGAVRDAASSAWRSIFENVFGNAEEATLMWTAFSDWLYDVFMGPTELLHNATVEWNRLGGRDGMLQGFANLAEALNSLTAPIKQAFRSIFGEITASGLGASLKDLTDKFVSFTEKLNISTPTFVKIRKIFEGIFSIFKTIGKVLGDVGHEFSILLGHITPLGGSLLDAAASLGEWVTTQTLFLRQKDSFISGFGDFVGQAVDAVKALHPLEWIFTNLQKAIDFTLTKLKAFGTVLKDTFNPITNGTLNFGNIFKLIGAIGAGGLLKFGLFDRLKELKGLVSMGFIDSIKAIFTGLADCMREVAVIDLSSKQMMNIAIALAVLSGSLFLLASIDPERLAGSMLAMVGLVELVNHALAKMMLLTKSGIKNSASLTLIATSMIAVSAAILILSFALKNISKLKPEEIVQGLITIGVLLAELSAFGQTLNGIKMSPGTGLSVILIATGLLIMSKAVEGLGKIDVKTLLKGLGSMAVILAEIAIFSKTVKMDGILKTSVSLVILGAAILVMAAGINKLGSMPFETTMNGLVGMAAGLTIFGVALRLIPSNLGAAASIAVLAVAMIPLATAFKILSTIPLEGIAKGLLAIIPTLGAAFVLFKFLNPVTTLAISAALVVFAAALNLLIPPFLAFGSLKLSSIGKALLAIGGALVIFGVAAALLTPVIPSMLGLAAAMLLFGVGVSAFASGVAVLAVSGVAAIASFIAGLQLLLEALPALTASFIIALDQIIQNILNFLLEKLPLYVELGSNVVIAFLLGLTEKLPELVDAAVTFIATFINSLADSLEKNKATLILGINKLIITILELVWGCIVGILKFIWGKGVDIYNAGKDFIIQLIEGVKEKIDGIKEQIREMIQKAKDALEEKWEDVKQWGRDIWEKIKEGFKNAVENVVDGVKSIGKNILNGLKNGLDDPDAVTSLLSKAGNVASSVLSKFKSVLGIASPSKETEAYGEYLMAGLSTGILESSGLAEDSAEEASGNILTAFKDSISKAIEDLKGQLSADVTLSPVLDLEAFNLGIEQMEGGLASVGETLNEAGVTEETAQSAAQNILNAFNETIAKAIDDLQNEMASDPTITPVIDLDKFNLGLDEMRAGLDTVGDTIIGAMTKDSVEEWRDAYKEWKEIYQGGAFGKTFGLTDQIAYHSSGEGYQFQYGQSTLDLVAAAASGFLNDDQIKRYNEIASEHDKARVSYIINQHNTFSNGNDYDEIYRQTVNGVKHSANLAAVSLDS